MKNIKIIMIIIKLESMISYYTSLHEDSIEIIEIDKDEKQYSVFKCSRECTQVYCGRHYKHKDFRYQCTTTSSTNSIILLTQIRKHKALPTIRFISPMFNYIFSLHAGDDILNFYSQVGDDNQLYPILETQKCLFFLENQLYIKKENLSHFIEEEDIINGYEKILKNKLYSPYIKIFRKRLYI